MDRFFEKKLQSFKITNFLHCIFHVLFMLRYMLLKNNTKCRRFLEFLKKIGNGQGLYCPKKKTLSFQQIGVFFFVFQSKTLWLL
jgi:hypothetical protein